MKKKDIENLLLRIELLEKKVELLEKGGRERKEPEKAGFKFYDENIPFDDLVVGYRYKTARAGTSFF